MSAGFWAARSPQPAVKRITARCHRRRVRRGCRRKSPQNPTRSDAGGPRRTGSRVAQVHQRIMRNVLNIVVVLIVTATAAHAQEWPRVNLFGGAQIADFGTDIKLDATATLAGSTIDFERDLGFNETAGVA